MTFLDVLSSFRQSIYLATLSSMSFAGSVLRLQNDAQTGLNWDQFSQNKAKFSGIIFKLNI